MVGQEFSDREEERRAKDLATDYGIPATMPVKSTFRIPGCVASVMQLIGIEDKYAIYQGVCPQRHEYKQKILLSEIQNENKVMEDEDFKLIDGKLSIGEGEGFQAGDLEDF